MEVQEINFFQRVNSGLVENNSYKLYCQVVGKISEVQVYEGYLQ